MIQVLHRASWLLLALCPAALCAEDGSSVVLLVNVSSAQSEAVAAHYAAKRGVPAANVFRTKCSKSEVMSRREYDAAIREPLRKFLVAGGLAREGPNGLLVDLKVKYLAATYGIPVKIREDYGDAKPEDLPRKPGEQNAAAVDSELCLVALPAYRIAGWLANPAYKTLAPAELLFATRLDGPTPELAMGLVDAALDAEAHGLAGLGYIDASGIRQGAYKAGDDWLIEAGAALKSAGYFTRIDRAPGTFAPDMPMPDAAFYFGWYEPALCGPMARSGFRFPVGAVAYHIHSGSAARLRTDRVGWAGPLLARGAAATAGAVFEPYLAGTLDTGEFARRFLAGGTFAESAGRAIPHLSWMMTLVGDPLYAPFRTVGEKPWPQKLPPVWRDLHDAVIAAEADDPAPALAICTRYPAEPLFVEMAARVEFRSGRSDEAMALYRKLAAMVKDDYSGVQAHLVIGDWLAASGRRPEALAAFLDCIRERGKSPHALPVYQKALLLARALHDNPVESALWEGLAANFPTRALGRFAAAELWARGLRRDPPPELIEVPRARGRPIIDGRPDDPAWQDAAVIDPLAYGPGAPGLNRAAGASGTPGRTRVRVTYDDGGLYVLAEVYPDPRAALYGLVEEAFDVTLSPWRDAVRSVTMSVSEGNGTAVLPGGATARLGVLQVQKGGAAHQVGWLAEIAIPFSALGLKETPKAAVWAANFVHKAAVPRFPFRIVPTFSSWAAPDGDPLAPDCAGYLIFR